MPKPHIVLRSRAALRTLLALLALALGTSACGLKGDLYLPADAPPQPAAAGQPPATATQDENTDDAGTHS